MSAYTDEPKADFIGLRLPHALAEDLRACAEATGLTVSDYLRQLISMSIRYDIAPLVRLPEPDLSEPEEEWDPFDAGQIPPTDDDPEMESCEYTDTPTPIETTPQQPSDGPARAPEPKALVLTDRAFRQLTLELSRWGTNYNQVVRGVNRIVRRVTRAGFLDPLDVAEIIEMLRTYARSNEKTWIGLGELRRDFDAAVASSRVLDLRESTNRRRRRRRRGEGKKAR